MKKKLVALLMCVGVLGFGVFGNVVKLDQTTPVKYMMTDPGGS
ncbi:hypothetical protein [Bacillus mycoides]|nr:hypothetical protein [Bacillus mycoides]MCQ6530525.1 hypothetical protein [Bacillus mycoides]